MSTLCTSQLYHGPRGQILSTLYPHSLVLCSPIFLVLSVLQPCSLSLSPSGTRAGFCVRDYILSCPLLFYFPLLALSCHSDLNFNITNSEKHPLTFQTKVFPPLNFYSMSFPLLQSYHFAYLPHINYIHISIYLSIYLSIYQHLSKSMYLPVYLSSICPPSFISFSNPCLSSSNGIYLS